MIPGSGRCPGEGNGCPLQCSRPETPVGRGAWRAAVHRAAEPDTTERLAVLLAVSPGINQNPQNVSFRVQQADSRVHMEEQRATDNAENFAEE